MNTLQTALVPVTPSQRQRAAFLLAQPSIGPSRARIETAYRSPVTVALATDDGESLDGALVDLGRLLGLTCGYCHEHIERGEGYCSRECWAADGGDA